MITKIKIDKKSVLFLEERGLSKQYRKTKFYILSGRLKQVNFKIRQPKEDGIYQFRINKQYRAFAKLYGNTLSIFEIYDHKR